MIKFVPLFRYCQVAFILLVFSANGYSQELTYGPHSVGFRILTFIDSTRYTANQADGGPAPYRSVDVHLWYPAGWSDGPVMTTKKYIASQVMENEHDSPNSLKAESILYGNRNAIRSWYGSFEAEDWDQLMAREWKAVAGAPFFEGAFPLLTGELRPTSTFITNEYMASHGYVVAFIRHHPFEQMSHQHYPTMSKSYLQMSRDMEFVTRQLRSRGIAGPDKLGTFGFSGSGFSQLHFAMLNPDVDALADIESGYFMEGLYQGLTALSTYHPYSLQVPFLHIFSRKLSGDETYIDSLYAMKYAEVYRLILEKPQHHWDFASEGYMAARFLNNRPEEAGDVIASFHLTNLYLRKFFDAFLKDDQASLEFIKSSPVANGQDPDFVQMEFMPRNPGVPDIAALAVLLENGMTVPQLEQLKARLKRDTLNPLSADIFSLAQIGRHYQRRGDLDRTLAMAEILLTVNPGDQQARQMLDNLGYMLMEFDRMDEAGRAFQASVNLFPDHHIPRFGLGEYYMKKGNKKEALDEFEKGLDLARQSDGYPEDLLEAHKRAFTEYIEKLKKEK